MVRRTPVGSWRHPKQTLGQRRGENHRLICSRTSYPYLCLGHDRRRLDRGRPARGRCRDSRAGGRRRHVVRRHRLPGPCLALACRMVAGGDRYPGLAMHGTGHDLVAARHGTAGDRPRNAGRPVRGCGPGRRTDGRTAAHLASRGQRVPSAREAGRASCAPVGETRGPGAPDGFSASCDSADLPAAAGHARRPRPWRSGAYPRCCGKRLCGGGAGCRA